MTYNPLSGFKNLDAFAPLFDPSILENTYGKIPFRTTKNVGRTIALKLTDDTTAPTAGDDFYQFHITEELDGTKLIKAVATVVTAASADGPITIQIRNSTSDMLTTALTIDDNEETSLTAATPHKVNRANQIFRKGDKIHIDIDDAGTGAAGLQLYLFIQ